MRTTAPQRVLAPVNRRREVLVQHRRRHARVDVLGECEDGARVGHRQAPFGAVDGLGHGPDPFRGFVLLTDVAEVVGDILHIVGVEVLRLAAVDAVANLLGALAAGGAGGEGGGRGEAGDGDWEGVADEHF